MGALNGPRNTPEMADFGREQVYPVEAATKIFLGSMVALNAAGNAVPASTSNALKVVGVALRKYNGVPGEEADNSGGAAGAISVVARRGVYRFDNSAGDAVAAAGIGKPCFAVDDHTVSGTDGGGAQSVAGKVAQIDAVGVWVDFWHQSALAS